MRMLSASSLSASSALLGSARQQAASSTAVADNEVAPHHFTVAIRVRPPVPRELNGPRPYRSIVQLDSGRRQICLLEEAYDDTVVSKQVFTFDNVFGPDDAQADVYEGTAKAAVMRTLQGYNASVLAYGQTGTGKTWSMEGDTLLSNDRDSKHRGIISRATHQLFSYIEENANGSGSQFTVRASYLQIYNEVIKDLLAPSRAPLPIREDKKKGLFVDGLSEWVVASPNDVYDLMRRGAASRATSATRINAISSRSHAVFTITVEQLDLDQSRKVGKLNLIDLAGSERVGISGSTGQRLEESKKINQSLSALGNVISALTSKQRTHIPYRDSKLTRILEDSLGGNCCTTMLACISPALDAFSESLSTLQFANRAKNIRNQPCVNENLDEKALLKRYERELCRLRLELSSRSASKLVSDVREQRREAERDQQATQADLERLQASLASADRDRRAMEGRLQSLTAASDEGVTSISNEEQIVRYQQLLIKQRDIMIQLTNRLNDRDSAILSLQVELQKYDKEHRAIENALDQKTTNVRRLQENASTPLVEMLRAENAMLRKRCEENAMVAEKLAIHLKERAALRVILESKIAYLVDRIDEGVNNDSTDTPAGTRREVRILKRLVHAAVAAIKHSDLVNQTDASDKSTAGNGFTSEQPASP